MSDKVEDAILKAIAEKPKWLEEQEDGSFKIDTKKGVFILEEQSGEIMEQCSRIAEKTNKSMESLLARRTIKSPETTDDEFSKLPGSVYTKIKMATIFIHGLNDFL